MTGAVFAIKVPLGLYREPGMRFYNPKSLKIPTISAVMGMLLGIAGVGSGSYGVDYMARDEFVKNHISGVYMGFGVVRMPEEVVYGGKDFLASRAPWQIIMCGHYELMLDWGEIESKHGRKWAENLVKRVRDKDYVFPPYAGMSSFPVLIDLMDYVESFEEVKPEELVDLNSAIIIPGQTRGICVGGRLYNIQFRQGMLMVNSPVLMEGYGKDSKRRGMFRIIASERNIFLIARDEDCNEHHHKLVRWSGETWLLTRIDLNIYG